MAALRKIRMFGQSDSPPKKRAWKEPIPIQTKMGADMLEKASDYTDQGRSEWERITGVPEKERHYGAPEPEKKERRRGGKD